MTDWPRLLRREKAAAYLGRSVGTFDNEVRAGLWPRPRKVGGVAVWDKRELDRWLDRMLDGQDEGIMAEIAAFAGLSRTK